MGCRVAAPSSAHAPRRESAGACERRAGRLRPRPVARRGRLRRPHRRGRPCCSTSLWKAIRVQNPSPAGLAPRTRLARLGGLIARHPRSWVAAWAVIAIACFAGAVGGVTGESLFERLHYGAPTVESESSRPQDVIAQAEPTLEKVTMQASGADLADRAAVGSGASVR